MYYVALFGIFEHRIDALLGFDAYIFVERDVLCLFGMTECLKDVFKRIRLHVLAHAAAADKVHVGVFVMHAGVEAAFREEQNAAVLGLFVDVTDHLAGASDVVAEHRDRRIAFGMAYDFEARVLAAEKLDEVRVVVFVDVAAAVVELDVLLDSAALHLVDDVLAHEGVRHKINLVARDGFDDVHHVTARDADIAGGLHVGGRVDVANERVVRILLAEFFDVLAGDGIGEAATRERARDNHVFLRVQNLGGFTHETHGGEEDRLLLNRGGVLAELETVAREVGNAQENFGSAIAVGEDNRVLVLFAFVDFVDEREHLFHLFHCVGAKCSARLDGLETVIKFFCSHGCSGC